MLLKNHIALRVLTDSSFAIEMVKESYPDIVHKICTDIPITSEEDSKVKTLYQLLRSDDQKAFYVTDSVLSKLGLLKINKSSGQYNWTVFNKVKDIKYTFILPPIPERRGGSCLRVKITKSHIEFAHISFQFDKGSHEVGQAYWVLFYVDRIKNIQCEHFAHHDVKSIEEFVYKLLCFVFLSENEEEVIKPGEKKGTRKNGKIINSLPIPLTIINSKWNITSIRTEGFDVSGHFRLIQSDDGARMIFINPYRKNGYKRIAKAVSVK